MRSMPKLDARNLLIALGVLLIVVAILVDVVGLGANERFGWKQGIVVAVGSALVVGGALWGRVSR